VRKGNLDAAIADYNRALEINQRGVGAYQSRGYAYLLKGDLARSIADLDRAIALSPKFADAYTARGLAYHRKGERDRALQDFRQAIDLPLRCGSSGWAHETAREYVAAPPSDAIFQGPVPSFSDPDHDGDGMEGSTL
jgi:tetratricopeptide (TPR) repeat protein